MRKCACGGLSPDDARFCGECGSPLPGTVPVRVEVVRPVRRRRPPRRARRVVARRQRERLTTALTLIIFSSMIMLMFGWECHHEYVSGWPIGEFEERCGPNYVVIAAVIVPLLVGIALLAYTVHVALRE